jgi:alkylation response protein AidB-like acyl-CoA dehydrogenase
MTIHDDPDIAEIGRTVREVLSRECPIERVRLVMSGDGHAEDAALWALAVELGWPALGVPEDAGGIGLGLQVQTLVAEELGASLFPTPLLATMIATAALCRPPLGEVASRTLAAITEGRAVAVAAGRTRTDGDADTVETEAILLAPGAPLLFGHEERLYLAPLYSPEESVLGVDLSRPTAPGSVRVRDAEITDVTASWLRTAGCILVGAELVGVGRRAVQIAVTQARDRRQFGRAIGQFQAVSHRIVDAAVSVARARSLVRDAAAAVDASPEGVVAPGTSTARAIAMAKASAGEAATAAVRTAIQVCGALGTTAEHPLPWLLRRARHGALVFGDARAHHQSVGQWMMEAHQ